MSLFTLHDVRYKHVLAIDHLEIEAQEVTSIVGRSGSGKSTLLRLLNRMISPDSGSITYKSHPMDAISPVELRRRVVMLPQTPVVFEGNVRENVLKGLEFSERAPVADAEITRLLDLMEISREIASGASSLSGGERQRVAIARVLAMRPEVLLLDEPTSALDASTQDTVIANLFTEARACDTRIIIVTHATAIADRWSDRIIEISAGRVASSVAGAAHG
jgi:putative ABC transport system ATP-binding protein